MKKLLTGLTAGLLMLGAPALLADSTTNTTSSATTEAPGQHKAQTAEQRKDRREAMKLVGLDAKELHGLSKEDRASKIKEAVQKFMSDEKAKKGAGTFTSEDQANVDLVKKVFAGHKKAKTASNN